MKSRCMCMFSNLAQAYLHKNPSIVDNYDVSWFYCFSCLADNAIQNIVN